MYLLEMQKIYCIYIKVQRLSGSTHEMINRRQANHKRLNARIRSLVFPKQQERFFSTRKQFSQSWHCPDFWEDKLSVSWKSKIDHAHMYIHSSSCTILTSNFVYCTDISLKFYIKIVFKIFAYQMWQLNVKNFCSQPPF